MWQEPYQKAILEVDTAALRGKVLKAEDAICARLQQLQGSSDSHAEKEAIQDALSVLKALKRDELNYPDWHST